MRRLTSAQPVHRPSLPPYKWQWWAAPPPLYQPSTQETRDIAGIKWLSGEGGVGGNVTPVAAACGRIAETRRQKESGLGLCLLRLAQGWASVCCDGESEGRYGGHSGVKLEGSAGTPVGSTGQKKIHV
ncbi:unnamed protein product [Boreogadus saida]